MESEELLNHIAGKLDKAAYDKKAIDQISNEHAVTITQAYQIQKKSINQRLDRDEKMIGYKMGFTSRAKMEQMGVHDIIWGRLTDKMEIQNNGSTALIDYIHPRVEPEIAFKIKKPIHSIINLEQVHEYIEAVAPALEIIDSRYQNFKFSLEDVVADNCSSSGFVIGDWQKADFDPRNIVIKMTINGTISQEGNSNAILGNPYESITEASKMMQKYGEEIPAGAIMLAGAATSAVFLKNGDEISTSFEKLGTVRFSVK